MPNNNSSDSVASLELTLLRWLCISAASDDARKRVLSALPGYKWHNTDHAIVFDALKRVPDRDKRPLREQLPAIATRMGFPDIAWEDYFVVSAPVSEEGIPAILRKLVDLGTTSQ
jgi:NAD(P)H-dependent FMN reductase